MRRIAVLLFVCLLVACSKGDEPSMKSDMTVPIGKGGIADDGIKPVPGRPTPVVGRAGQNDDGIKPVTIQKPTTPSVQPVPKK